jgi:hypothetical protein
MELIQKNDSALAGAQAWRTTADGPHTHGGFKFMSYIK